MGMPRRTALGCYDQIPVTVLPMDEGRSVGFPGLPPGGCEQQRGHILPIVAVLAVGFDVAVRCSLTQALGSSELVINIPP